MLEVRGVSKSYRKRKVLDKVNISLNRGEITGILGPNGAGKTTLFKIIIGLVSPDEGEILLDGVRINGFNLYQLIRMGIGYLPQEPSLFTGLSVYENLKLAASGNKDSEEKIDEIIQAMNINEIKDCTSENLSGGEKRRLEVARSLLLNPSYMLFDEPFSQIDPKTVYELMGIIKKMREKNIGILITDHSAREVFKVCDRIYILSDGKVIVEGTPEELKQNQTVKEIYLGQLFEI